MKKGHKIALCFVIGLGGYLLLLGLLVWAERGDGSATITTLPAAL